eukprot:TRINITY_DN45352_c0_g1_i1.p1 TRINITY_DN45352_c0_g1~~TRINITY_DN45352_c0_g1_i1.p1  ORF type:complete len:264 (-),score=40.78 TRINITY_DN45352_c0_g1_i1:199-990(-)
MADWDYVRDRLPVGKSDEDKKKRKDLWIAFNRNRGGGKSLALFELDAGIEKVLNCPELFNAKPVIRRAYHYARAINPEGPVDTLEWGEFRLLLVYLRGLFDVYKLFTTLDTANDKKLSYDELESSMSKLSQTGIQASDPKKVWKELTAGTANDTVDFGEFADWATRQGLAGPELLEVATSEEKAEVTAELNTVGSVLRKSGMCHHDGLVHASDLAKLLQQLDPTFSDEDVKILLGASSLRGGTCGEDLLLDTFIGDLIASHAF